MDYSQVMSVPDVKSCIPPNDVNSSVQFVPKTFPVQAGDAVMYPSAPCVMSVQSASNCSMIGDDVVVTYPDYKSDVSLHNVSDIIQPAMHESSTIQVSDLQHDMSKEEPAQMTPSSTWMVDEFFWTEDRKKVHGEMDKSNDLLSSVHQKVDFFKVDQTPSSNISNYSGGNFQEVCDGFGMIDQPSVRSGMPKYGHTEVESVYTCNISNYYPAVQEDVAVKIGAIDQTQSEPHPKMMMQNSRVDETIGCNISNYSPGSQQDDVRGFELVDPDRSELQPENGVRSTKKSTSTSKFSKFRKDY